MLRHSHHILWILLIGIFSILPIASLQAQKVKLKTIRIPFKEDSTKTEYKYTVLDQEPYDVKHGSYYWYFDTGKIKAKTTYKNGYENGPYTTYHRNGRARSKGTFKDGYLNGEVKNYYTNGNVENEGLFEQGLKQGIWKFYSKSGKLIKKEAYRDGQLIE